jgi:hypothetical protein
LCALSTRPSPIAVVPALLLVVVALWEVCSTPRAASSVPGDKAWAKAAEVVRAGHRPGDLVVFAPDWVDPVGRLHLGDLIPIDMAARSDADLYARIWEVSIRGKRSPDTKGLAQAQSTTVGDITVALYERAPASLVTDLRTQLSTAQVQGPARPTLELTEVGFAPHRCIQVTPPPNQPVVVTFPKVQLGTKLVGYAGLADIFTRRSPRGPGTLDVEIDGKRVASVVAGVDSGWVRFEAPTQPGVADIAFRLSAKDPNRLICFTAETRR